LKATKRLMITEERIVLNKKKRALTYAVLYLRRRSSRDALHIPLCNIPCHHYFDEGHAIEYLGLTQIKERTEHYFDKRL
jgi:hypothetical protein